MVILPETTIFDTLPVLLPITVLELALLGPERKSAVIEAKNRELVAYHEGGHALVALYTPGAMPIYKATIVPRGSALGMVCTTTRVVVMTF